MKIPVGTEVSKDPPIFIYKNYLSKSYGTGLSEPNDQNETDDIPQNSSCCNFFKISCDIGYYQLLIPFRFKRNSDGGWDLHKNIIQQILCSISHVLILFQYFTEIRRFPLHKLNTGASEYFRWFQRIWSFFYHLILVKTLWKAKEKFHLILQYLSHSNLPKSSIKVQSKLAVTSICLFYIVVSIACHIFGHGVIRGPSDFKNLTWFYRRYVQIARFNFFLSNESNYTIAPGLQAVSTIDTGLAVVTFTGYYFRNLFAYYSDGLVLMACLTLWVPARGMSNLIRSEIIKVSQQQGPFSKPFIITRVVDSYYALKQLSHVINDAMSIVVLAYMVECIIYFSTHLNALLVAPDWLKRWRAGTLFANSIAVFYFSGDIGKQVGYMREWLSLAEVCEKLSQNRFALLLHEVKNRYIGISGNIFMVDYSSIFNIIGTLLTYFIICSQGEHD